MLRYMELIQNPRRFLALTGYTVDEFRALLSFFRVRFQAYVAHFTLEGKPRQNRTDSTYENSTFPTMEDGCNSHIEQILEDRVTLYIINTYITYYEDCMAYLELFSVI